MVVRAFFVTLALLLLGVAVWLYRPAPQSGPPQKTIVRLGDPGLRHDSRLLSVAVFPDDQTLAVGTKAGPIHLWDLKTFAPIKTLPGHPNGTESLAVYKNALVSGGWDKKVRIWDSKVLEYDHHGTVKALAISSAPGPGSLATAASSIQLWTPKTGLNDVLAHRGAKDIAFSPSGALLASVSNQGLELWAPQTKALLNEERSSSQSAVAFFPDGRIATADHDGTVILRNASGHPYFVAQLRGHPWITDLAITRGNKLLMTTRQGDLWFCDEL